jgi:hypothetical protein
MLLQHAHGVLENERMVAVSRLEEDQRGDGRNSRPNG